MYEQHHLTKLIANKQLSDSPGIRVKVINVPMFYTDVGHPDQRGVPEVTTRCWREDSCAGHLILQGEGSLPRLPQVSFRVTLIGEHYWDWYLGALSLSKVTGTYLSTLRLNLRWSVLQRVAETWPHGTWHRDNKPGNSDMPPIVSS